MKALQESASVCLCETGIVGLGLLALADVLFNFAHGKCHADVLFVKQFPIRADGGSVLLQATFCQRNVIGYADVFFGDVLILATAVW